MASTARIDELRKKFEENPRRYFAPLANEYRKSGDINQAIAICREYLPQQPGHMSGHIVYGQALYEARQFDEAKTVFETALSLDPENLIALRHLGDIALIIGDNENARVWYRRVLEADPRNEEIQAQLATLDQVASAAPTPAVNPAIAAAHPVPASAVPAKPALASAPTVVMSAVPRPGQAAPKKAEPPPEIPLVTVTPDSPTAEVRLDTIPTHAPPETERPVEMALGLEPTSFVPSAEPVPPTPALEIDTPVSASKEASPLDSFSLAGLETTSLAAGQPPAPPQGAPEAAAPPAIDLDFDTVAPAAPPPPTPAPAAIPELPLLDIGDLPSAPAAAAPSPYGEAVPPATEMFIPDVAAETPAVAESGPFVTETMAELYLQQGHRDEALRVYRALLEQRPGDASLQAKVAGLSPAPAAVPPVAHEEPARADGGPTIREILNLIAMRRPGSHPELPRQNGATPEAPAASLGTDALAMLFGHVYIAPPDEDAATALALAFMDLDGLESGAGVAPQSEGISGAPARRASTDLSLDTVFGGAEAPANPAPSSFSFDQFFSQRATAEHAGQSGTAAGNTESRDDVTQFTQWLEGLKQR